MTAREQTTLNKLSEDIGYIRGVVEGLKSSFDTKWSEHADSHKVIASRCDDHDTRLRDLEATKQRGQGAVILGRVVTGAIGGLIGTVVAILTILQFLGAMQAKP